MDRYDQISLLFDAEQLFLMEALSCESQALDARSNEHVRLLQENARRWQKKAQHAGAWKRRLEQGSGRH